MKLSTSINNGSLIVTLTLPYNDIMTSGASVTVPASDVFKWGNKIQGNDAQLFVYLINNNGNVEVGVSPCPILATVAGNYYSNGTQTGTACHKNIVMSGIRDAVNSCEVVGRVNVHQMTNNNWQSPTIAKIVNTPIFNTDWLSWTPVLSSSTLTFSNTNFIIRKYKIIGEDVKIDLFFTTVPSGTPTADIYATVPVQSALASSAPMVTGAVLFLDESSTPSTFGGCFLSGGTPDKLTFRKYNNTNWHNSGTIIINASNNGYTGQ